MRPPQHSIDATPVLVLLNDPAWDHDRVDAETQGLSEAELAEHPWCMYISGATRYDLNARCKWKGGEGTPADYLNEGAVKYTLKRHNLSRAAEIQDAVDREMDSAIARGGKIPALNSVFLKSAKHGIAEISGDPVIEGVYASTSGVPDRVLTYVFDNYGGLDAISKIGAAAWHLSKPLSEAEKKR